MQHGFAIINDQDTHIFTLVSALTAQASMIYRRSEEQNASFLDLRSLAGQKRIRGMTQTVSAQQKSPGQEKQFSEGDQQVRGHSSITDSKHCGTTRVFEQSR